MAFAPEALASCTWGVAPSFLVFFHSFVMMTASDSLLHHDPAGCSCRGSPERWCRRHPGEGSACCVFSIAKGCLLSFIAC
jgi:hypothetical protein